MSEIVVLGAGLGGTLVTYELLAQLRPEDRLTLIGQDARYHFVPSNPWVAVGWRERADIEADLSGVMQKKGVRYLTQGAQRVDPQARRVEMSDGESIAYDYLVIATGPELAFDEIEGLGPSGHTQSICHVDHAVRAHDAFEAFCKNPGPIVVGAVQGASCFGPAYEFAYILDTELRKRRIRDRVKMTFVTPEPYIGHLGLDGVGDTKSLMESEFRNRHISWITNAKVKQVSAGMMSVEEVDDTGARAQDPRAAVRLLDDAAGIPRRVGDTRAGEAGESARLRVDRRVPAQPDLSRSVRHRRLRRDPAGRADTGSARHAKDRLHDRIDGHRHRGQHRPAAARRAAEGTCHLECGLPRRLRRRRCGLRGAAADSAAQRQLVGQGPVGASGEGGRSRNTSCARCAPARASRSTRASCCASSTSPNSNSPRSSEVTMSAAAHIVCPHCGTVNRVPSERRAEAARCGGCHQALFDAHPAAVDEAGFERHVRASARRSDGTRLTVPQCGQTM